MGLMQRRKGRSYEQHIARALRAAFPAADVRRTSQADRAGNSDVIVIGSPLLQRLWLELNDARDPNPLTKLQQAERDIELARPAHDAGVRRLPVVVWHRIRERTHQVTTRLWVLDELRRRPHGAFDEFDEHVRPDADLDSAAVTLDFGAFIVILRALSAVTSHTAPQIEARSPT